MRKIGVYSGVEPYIFISYSHKDSAIVLPIVEQLDKMGFRVWFDEGIEVGSEWPQFIAEHIKKCEIVLNFISKNYEESLNCRSEITFALDLKKRFLSVYLIDDLNLLSDGLRMQLSINQAIWYNRYNSLDGFCNALVAAKILETCKKERNTTNEKTSSYEENSNIKSKPVSNEAVHKPDSSVKQAEQSAENVMNSQRLYSSDENAVNVADKKSDYMASDETENNLSAVDQLKSRRREDSKLVKILKRITGIISFLYVIIGPVVLNIFVEVNHGSDNLFLDCLLPMCFPLTILSVINLIIVNSQKNKLTSDEYTDIVTSEWLVGFLATILSLFVYTLAFGLKYFNFFIGLIFVLGLTVIPFIISFLIFAFAPTSKKDADEE